MNFMSELSVHFKSLRYRNIVSTFCHPWHHAIASYRRSDLSFLYLSYYLSSVAPITKFSVTSIRLENSTIIDSINDVVDVDGVKGVVVDAWHVVAGHLYPCGIVLL